LPLLFDGGDTSIVDVKTSCLTKNSNKMPGLLQHLENLSPAVLFQKKVQEEGKTEVSLYSARKLAGSLFQSNRSKAGKKDSVHWAATLQEVANYTESPTTKYLATTSKHTLTISKGNERVVTRTRRS
jgi:hypothetical protein